jgi:hypothetical protein
MSPSSGSKSAACVSFEETTKLRERVGGIIIADALFEPEDGVSIYLRNDGNIAPFTPVTNHEQNYHQQLSTMKAE